MASDRTYRIGGQLRSAVIGLVAALALVPGVVAGSEVRGEYDVKAAIVFNILKFVEWPADVAQTELHLCLAGNLSDAGPFLDLRGQSAGGRRLSVDREGTAPGEACNVLFFGGQDRPRLKAAIEDARGRAILIIAEQQGAAHEGAVVNLTITNKKVRFEINAGEGRRARLRISSKLLKLAGTVIDNGAAGD